MDYRQDKQIMKTIKIVIPIELPDDLTPEQLAGGIDKVIKALGYDGNIRPESSIRDITREITVETKGDGWVRANKFRVHLGRFNIL